jgi:hypothetical protein
VFFLVAGKIGRQAIAANGANEMANQIPHAASGGGGVLRLAKALAHDIGF